MRMGADGRKIDILFVTYFSFFSYPSGLKSNHCNSEFPVCVCVCSSLVRFSLFGSPLKSGSSITTKLGAKMQ